MKIKGISPVIATLLLILIAVAAAVLVYVWVTGYASSMAQTSAPELQEQIKIDAVSAKSVNSTPYYDVISIFPRSIGDVTANITTLYIIEAETGEIVVAATEFKLELSPGSVANITIALNYNKDTGADKLFINGEVSNTANIEDNTGNNGLKKGTAYIVKAVTRNGVEASLSFTIGG